MWTSFHELSNLVVKVGSSFKGLDEQLEAIKNSTEDMYVELNEEAKRRKLVEEVKALAADAPG
eukprot:4654372-Prorocentrum_lima.AAC.1